ncbi:MAG: class I SAM-dependent methyltransferase [Pseudomonadota bacterium]
MLLAKLLPQRVLSQQARKPSGFIGRFLMSNIFKKGNNDLNCFVEEVLKLQPSSHVLEIGFGPGKLISMMALTTTEGHVEGIDFSETMLDEAVRLNRQYISSNRVRIQKGDCRKLTYKDNTFDKVCSVNTLYFWNPPEIYLSEIFRVLKPGGNLVLGIRDSEQMDKLPLDKNIFSTYSLKEAVDLVSKAGFLDAHVQEKSGTSLNSYCVVGTKALVKTGTQLE